MKLNTKHTSGFSLIELLAAMAILMVIVLLMTTIFANSDRVWAFGTGQANNCTDGRAAMNMLAHDLEYAVADEILTFAMDYDRDAATKTTYGFDNNEICFVSLENDAKEGGDRTAWEVHYYLKGTNGVYGLRRAYWSDLVTTPNEHAYKNRTWYKTGGTNPGRPTSGDFVAQNVVGFALYAPAPPSALPSRIYYSAPEKYSAPSDKAFVTNRLPAYVDVLLEVLDEDAAERAADLARNFGEDDAKTVEFVEKNMRRYTTRVYLNNRNGYKRRVNLLR